MEVLIVYPPKAYRMMPYLSSFLLAGIAKAAEANATVLDLNARYWRDIAATDLMHPPHGASRKTQVAYEAVREFGPEALRSLRSPRTFDTYEVIEFHHAVLTLVGTFEQQYMRELHPTARTLPTSLGSWSEVVNGWDGSPAARYIEEEVQRACQVDRPPDLVAISAAYLPQLPCALLTARAFKCLRPTTQVVIGGNSVTHYVDELKRDPSFFEWIDAAVPFEGDTTFVKLLESARCKRPLGGLSNVMTIDGSKVSYDRNLTQDVPVDEQPDFSTLDPALYPTPTPIIPLLTSRGCYWGKCTFCTHHEGYGRGYKRVDDEVFNSALDAALTAGYRAFYFVDEALPPRQLAALRDRFLEINAEGDEVMWMAEARVERSLTSEEAAVRFRDSGCRLLVSGIESASPSVLEKMEKGTDPALVALQAHNLAKAGGVRTGWMFFLGFPGETEEDRRTTIEYIQANASVVDFVSLGVFALERGSPLWNSAGTGDVLRIVNRSAPYKIEFDYIDSAGQLVRRVEGSQVMHDAVAANGSLGEVLTRALDRSVWLFTPPKIPGCDSFLNGADAEPVLRTWISDSEGAEVAFDHRAQNFRICAEVRS